MFVVYIPFTLLVPTVVPQSTHFIHTHDILSQTNENGKRQIQVAPSIQYFVSRIVDGEAFEALLVDTRTHFISYATSLFDTCTCTLTCRSIFFLLFWFSTLHNIVHTNTEEKEFIFAQGNIKIFKCIQRLSFPFC